MYNEELQEQALSTMIESGFPVGRLVYDPKEALYFNVVLSTDEDGPFWYGDIEGTRIPELVEVANKLNKSIRLNNELVDLLISPSN